MRLLYKTVLIFLGITLALTGCANNNLDINTQKKSIKVIVKNRNHDFWAVVEMGAQAASKEFNVDIDFDGPDDEKDIDGQIAMVKQAINDKADAIVLAASDYVQLVAVAEKAKAANIPVIIIDSNIQSNNMDSFIGTDNFDAGKKLGESLIDKVGDKCEVAIMSFVKGAATANQREAGFLNAISTFPGIEVVETAYCNSDEALAKQLTMDIVENNPSLSAVVCLNAYGTVGTAWGIDELGQTGQISIIGFDSTPEEISYLEKDIIQSLVIQNPFNMGYLGVKYAFNAINNDKIPENVNTGSEVIDKENMYLPENQKLVFPFTN